jgi:hydroxymethylbilane synthase
MAQAQAVLALCRAAFPHLQFEIKTVKTTGDKLHTASLAKPAGSLPKGLFTKELEVALLQHQADLAVHSLKDLPTSLPEGLKLGAVTERAEVRDVLICRVAQRTAAGEHSALGSPHSALNSQLLTLADLPSGASVATSSTRRREQLLAQRPDLNIVELRGNVGTRLQKLACNPELDATILAAAGLNRLGFQIEPGGRLTATPHSALRTPHSALRTPHSALRTPHSIVPPGLVAVYLSPEIMLPCVGQAAIGIEVRAGDERLEAVCARLDHYETRQCVSAERSFLQAMGGGCQSPVTAYAVASGSEIWLRAISFRTGKAQRAEARGPISAPEALGKQVAVKLDPGVSAESR